MTTLGILATVALVAVLMAADLDRARCGTATPGHLRSRRAGWLATEVLLGVVTAAALLPRLWELAT